MLHPDAYYSLSFVFTPGILHAQPRLNSGIPPVPTDILDSGFTSWQWLNPLPQGNDLYDVCIVDSTTIVGVGWYGTIRPVGNSGATWEVGDRTGGLATILMGVHFHRETQASW